MVHAAPGVGVGASVNTTLRTSFFANVTAAATGVFTAHLKPGSAFDPCGDLSDIQAPGYDSWAAAFARYKVNSAFVRITVHGQNGNNSTNFVCAAYPSVNTAAVATYQAAASQPYAKTHSGGFQLQQNGVGCGSGPFTLKFKLSNDKIVGYRGDPTDTGALVTSDPPATQFMVLPIFLQANSATASTWMLEIDIWQNVTFSQRKTFVDA